MPPRLRKGRLGGFGGCGGSRLRKSPRRFAHSNRPGAMAAVPESKENNGHGVLRKRRSSAELGAPTAGSKQDAPKRFRRKSIEQLIATEGSLRIRVARGKKGFGFNLRGTTGVSGAKRQRGQYVRSVDFGSPAHEAGLRVSRELRAPTYALYFGGAA